MGTPTPEDPSRAHEIPIVLHETAEFDVASDLGYKGAAAGGGFTRCEHLHPLMDFDCSQQVEEDSEVALRLTFHLQDCQPSPSLARDVLELLYALHEYDKALGGRGLGLERTRSRAGDGTLSLVLRPNERHGAADRFRRMAEQLGSPITADLPEAPSDPIPNNILADVASLWEQTGLQQGDGATETPDLTVPRERVRGYRVQFALVPCAA